MSNATDTEPQILLDGEAYAVWVVDGWFSKFDELGLPVLSSYESCFTKQQADETARQICHETGMEFDEDVKVRLFSTSRRGGYRVRDSDGDYNEATIESAPVVRSSYDDVPDWFKAAMMANDPNDPGWHDVEKDDGLLAVDLFEDLVFQKIRCCWLDHYGWSGTGEDSRFVSEPYHLELEDFENIIEVCRKLNFDFRVTGSSHHYPSMTLRVEISPRVRLSYQKRPQ